jgi:uncharacterized membrane protein
MNRDITDPELTRTVLDGIGNTPLIRVDGIWVKLEYLNPSGSIKARIARIFGSAPSLALCASIGSSPKADSNIDPGGASSQPSARHWGRHR